MQFNLISVLTLSLGAQLVSAYNQTEEIHEEKRGLTPMGKGLVGVAGLGAAGIAGLAAYGGGKIAYDIGAKDGANEQNKQNAQVASTIQSIIATAAPVATVVKTVTLEPSSSA